MADWASTAPDWMAPAADWMVPLTKPEEAVLVPDWLALEPVLGLVLEPALEPTLGLVLELAVELARGEPTLELALEPALGLALELAVELAPGELVLEPGFAASAALPPEVTLDAAEVTGDAAAWTADSTPDKADDADLADGCVSMVAAWACREKTSMMTRIPAVAIASCTARRAMRRTIGCCSI